MTTYHRASPQAFERGPKWDLEREEKLRELHKLGMSASQIAKALGGITRNAVIGKSNRMHLGPIGGGRASQPGRIGAATVSLRRARAEAAKTARPPRIRVVATGLQTFVEAPARPPAVDIDAKKFAPIRDFAPVPFGASGCKWPVGSEGADMLCCGQPRKPRPERKDLGPYCVTHAAVAFQPLKPAKTVARAMVRLARRFA